MRLETEDHVGSVAEQCRDRIKLPAMVLRLVMRLAEQHDASLGKRYYRARWPEYAARTPNDPTGLAEARLDANSNKSIDAALMELDHIPRNSSGYDVVILTLQVLQEL